MRKSQFPAELRRLGGTLGRFFWLYGQFFLRRWSFYAHDRPKKKTKLRISSSKFQITVTIEYYFESNIEQRQIEAQHDFSLLWAGPGLLRLPIGMSDWSEAADTHLEEGTLGLQFDVSSRLSELRREAKEENLPYSERSEHDLFKFFFLYPAVARPRLFLLENGNLRALWRNSEGEQIGLQFRGGEQVQYVIFARRGHTDAIARSAGRDLLLNVERLIEAHDAEKLIFASQPA